MIQRNVIEIEFSLSYNIKRIRNKTCCSAPEIHLRQYHTKIVRQMLFVRYCSEFV
ncbi:hypothetical protein RUMCAL_03004 [Ruminococcus callidus ATCC 27760]|uniref:Uncharacterized protein n=1 Tax=Ruminococcus callidus ATCC 27760 TaxID=411473 RepID=U2KAM1_9FIRM|nr:hypothetical protein RUMCAL_03004 [Ruminococcus callidus ATCC 27760]